MAQAGNMRKTKRMTAKELMEAELCAAQIAEWSDKCDRRCPLSNMFELFVGIVQENKSLKSQIKDKFEYPSK
jgi:hypothetical protein